MRSLFCNGLIEIEGVPKKFYIRCFNIILFNNRQFNDIRDAVILAKGIRFRIKGFEVKSTLACSNLDLKNKRKNTYLMFIPSYRINF